MNELFIKQYLVCPICKADLVNQGQSLSCTGCRATYVVEDGIPNMVVQKDLKENSFDYLSHYTLDSEQFDYFEKRSGATEHSERRLREMIQRQVPDSASSILDVGCGSAWVAKAYLPKGKTVVSLDASTVNPRKANTLYPSERHHGVAANAFQLPFRNNVFDCIIAAEIIEHVPDPAEFVKELLGVLAPGGSLIISTPYKETIRYELCIHCNKLTPANAHLHSFDEKKLQALSHSDELASFRSVVFNNKLLLVARTYVLLRYLPLSLWKMTDRLMNLILNKPVNIIALYRKKAS